MSESNHIPTMPQASNQGHVPTMPQASNQGHVPTMPQASNQGHVPTMPQASNQGHTATAPQASTPTTVVRSNQILQSEIRFVDNRGLEYIIDGRNPVSVDTGEAQIYKCKNIDGSGDFIAKILVSLRPNEKVQSKLLTRRKVNEFLQKYSNDENSHILPLITSGTLTINGEDYFVDIYPYCEGGDICASNGYVQKNGGTLSYEILKNELIPAINTALSIFHKEKMVHRDLKPDNIFYYNGKFVIGDFGITCELNANDYAVDREKIGTLGYFAPELMSEAAIEKSDYYSFGQTIWTLYHGDMMYRMAIMGNGGFFNPMAKDVVSNLMRQNKLFNLDEIDKKDEFLEVLIRGLLQYDPNSRFGYDEVIRWLNGDKKLYTEVTINRKEEIFNKAIIINDEECIENGQVAKQLALNWNKSIELFWSGGLYNQYKFTLERDKESKMIQDIHNRVTDNIKNIPELEDFYKNVGLSNIIMHLSDDDSLCWDGAIFRNQEDISKYISDNYGQERNVRSMSALASSGLIKEWLTIRGVANEKSLDEAARLESIAKLSKLGLDTSYYWLNYMFAENRNNNAFKNCKGVNQLARLVFASANNLYFIENDYCMAENPELLGYIASLGYDESVYTLINDLDGDYRKQYDMLFDFFENNITEQDARDVMHQAYYNFGPKSHLIWWKNNLSLYEFVGEYAKNIENNINSIVVNPLSDLASQRAELTKLDREYDDFNNYYKVNFVKALAGIRRIIGTNYISSRKLTGLIAYRFLNQNAPIGFKYYLDI